LGSCSANIILKRYAPSISHIFTFSIKKSFFAGLLASPLNRIIGGLPASPGEFPYQVSLQVFDHSLREFTPVCGGAILNPTTILSAAHCTLVDPEGLYRIVAGEHDLSFEEGNEQFRIVEHAVIHNGFDEFYYYNDIALYFLSPASPLVFNKFVGKVDLPPSNIGELEASVATVAGWGSDSDSEMILKPSSSGSNILNKITVPIYDSEKCREIYGDDYIEEMMLCAGNLDGGQDACAGDSGGPLVSMFSGKKTITGLVSWGSGCGQKGYLGVYTKVNSYIEWIEYVIKVML
jgi:secreted trypsin-like serine protease